MKIKEIILQNVTKRQLPKIIETADTNQQKRGMVQRKLSFDKMEEEGKEKDENHVAPRSS